MTVAPARASWSLRHDLIVPGLAVIGLWLVGAVYYAQHTFAGGLIATPDQAVAAAMHAPCIAAQRESDRAGGWRVDLARDRWVVHKEFYDYRIWTPRRRLSGSMSAELDATTGRMISCRVGVSD